ncbi:nucleotidyltransferase family protein [Nocardioides sp. URHA0020]|uniref:nucleotidyltransferase family protein n=1 Tax=Nocardioides sp. URHA0020 TaxID=1380392 RepID=UPI00056AABA4|nr:NTP transferase domain-containing protein [Nocardioides sp. URHA0020]
MHGLLLAAGAGSRMGMPKALVRAEDGEPWLVRGVRTLTDGGCDPVTVVLGASADQALPLLDGAGVDVVVAADWAEGMSASLRAGLAALAATDAVAAVVSLVDLPDVGPEVVRRLVAETDAGTLRRASYDGRVGHPVVLGRQHWAGVLAETTGDRGARGYLGTHEVQLVECGDLATGQDVDAR